MLDGLNTNQTKHIIQILIGVFALFLFYALRIFIDAFLGAVIIYVLFRPFMHYLSVKKKWNRIISAFLIILLTLFIIIIPLGYLGSYMVSKLINFVGDASAITNMVNTADEKIRAVTGMRLLSPQNIQSVTQKITIALTAFLGTTANLIGDVVIMYFLLYYLLVSSGKVLKSLEEYLPFSHQNVMRFSKSLEQMTYSNALGTPLIAIVQSIASAIGFKIFGLNDPIFWGIMVGLGSFVPAVGSAIIWIPASVIPIIEGHTGMGLGLLAYSIVFIVGLETVLRISLQRKLADVHPLITILGFIIGVQLFGIPGIIFGPLLLSWFLLLLEVYRDEFVEKVHKGRATH